MRDWSDEPWVKLYQRDEADWLAMPLEAQAVLTLALRKFDRAGFLGLGRRGLDALPAILGHQGRADFILAGAKYLIESDGCWQLTNDGRTLFWENYYPAQTAKMSDRARQQLKRERDRDVATRKGVSDQASRHELALSREHIRGDGTDDLGLVTPAVTLVVTHPPTPGHASGHASCHASGHASCHASGHVGGHASGHASGHEEIRSEEKRRDLISQRNKDRGPIDDLALSFGEGEEDEDLRPRALMDLWNEVADPAVFPRAQKLTDARRKHLKARLRERPKLEEWRLIIQRMNRAPWLRGESGKGNWVADFDWLISTADASVKIQEGKYDPRTSLPDGKPAPRPITPGTDLYAGMD